MRRALVALLPLLVASPSFAADCSADVTAAFLKQRDAKMYRVAMTQPTAEGEAQMTVDYQLPDKMLQTVVAPSMPGDQQTMLVSGRAFAGSGGSFEELLPQFTQSIVSEFVTSTTAELKLGKFECLGKQTYEGKEYVGFRTVPEAAVAGQPAMARTIYADPVTGLPAFNIVAEATPDAKPVMRVTYTYPTDINIVAPEGAPVQKQPN
jgi:hypothetical protein